MLLKAYADLPPRKRIGILAIILGIAAAFIGNPSNTTITSVNIKEIALKSEKDVNRVTVNDLASWIIKGNMDYRLVDLRNESEYNEYNIPTSENISTGSLVNSDLKRNGRIILYSNDDIVASQAWFILKSSEFKSVYILKGGLEVWKNEVIFPVCKCVDNPDQGQKHIHTEKEEIAKFFGGQLESSANNAIVKKDTPKLKAPAKVTLKRTRTKKAREGC